MGSMTLYLPKAQWERHYQAGLGVHTWNILDDLAEVRASSLVSGRSL
jgi:hypothetical protein